ncbi:MAG: hypothetical protein AAGF19_06635 [Pseudomonadota bacterium]
MTRIGRLKFTQFIHSSTLGLALVVGGAALPNPADARMGPGPTLGAHLLAQKIRSPLDAEPGTRAHAPGNADVCFAAAYSVEHAAELPRYILQAITLTETGRRSEDGKRMVPWPWTINVGGKGYQYRSKAEAVAAARGFVRQGHTSIDVGCAQINLKFHPRAFDSMEAAFDPPTNLSYAARLLKDRRADTKSWQQALAHYHSYTAKHGKAYAQKVMMFWEQRKRARAAQSGQIAQADAASR